MMYTDGKQCMQSHIQSVSISLREGASEPVHEISQVELDFLMVSSHTCMQRVYWMRDENGQGQNEAEIPKLNTNTRTNAFVHRPVKAVSMSERGKFNKSRCFVESLNRAEPRFITNDSSMI